MGGTVDHVVVASADLETGIRWVEERTGVRPVLGGVHDGVGTRNALLGLGTQYLEVLARDPAQPTTSSPLSEIVETTHVPAVAAVAIARSGLRHPVPMSRTTPGGTRLEWELEFTGTPLFFIDWKSTPRPSGLPDGGRLSSVSITTPEPDALAGVEGVDVHEGPWRIVVTIDGMVLA